jgi:hypothetical protein
MKIAVKYLVTFGLIFLLAGCATRVGNSQKLTGYDVKLENLAVVYSEGKFGHEGIGKKLERYNFQNMGEYIAKAAPHTFPNYGISASVYTRTADSGNPSPKEKQILFITPARVEAEGHKGLFGEVVVSGGPSSTPIKVQYEVNMFDALLNKEVWNADFYIVAGGLLYSAFDEEKATGFLNDILGKLEADGLAGKIQSAQK